MSDATDLAVARCKINEGFRPTKYLDTRGFLTIGYGFCVDMGISEYAAEKLLEAQLEEAETDAEGAFKWYYTLDDVRRSVIAELVFNMGLSHLLGFTKMLDACTREAWDEAANELLHSAWFGQVGNRRGLQLARLLRDGGTT
jgi:lysozyme